MNKHAIHIATLIVLPFLLTEQLAKSAFSEVGPRIQPLSTPLRLNGWVADFRQDITRTALKNYARDFKEISIFGVAATTQGRLASDRDFIARAMAAARGLTPRPRMLLTVANIRPHRMHDHWLLEQWIGTPVKRAQHIEDLVELAKQADGLDIDYENLSPGDGPRFTEFIVGLGRALHAQNKILTVTVEHQTFMSGEIRWAQLSESVDRVRVMAYHYHYGRTAAGAISPPQLVYKLAVNALLQIPPQKLEIALPIYGFDWTRPGEARLVSTVKQYQRLAHQPGAVEFRDAETQSARIAYSQLEGQGAQLRWVQHQVWYEDPTSVVHKIRMLQSLGIVHVGVWQMAVGDIRELFEMVGGRQLQSGVQSPLRQNTEQDRG